MISIIVPVYKSEKTLRRCVDSLLDQTYQNIEIILIVDGPSDQSGMIADQMARETSKIRVLHQENQGVSIARNTGIRNAKGKYILFVDSDDYVERFMCEKMLSSMITNDSDMILCGFHHWYFNKDVEKSPFIEGTFTKTSGFHILLELYQEQFLNMPWNKLFKKEYITETFKKDLSLGEDLIFNLNYMKNITSFTIMGDMLYHYIQDNRGTTLSTRRREDRIETALLLYEQVGTFFWEEFATGECFGIPESKVVVEFLDEIEGLYFQKDLSVAQRKQTVRAYKCALNKLPSNVPVNLKKLDYKVIYFFLKRDFIGMTYCLIHLRGIIVRLIKKR